MMLEVALESGTLTALPILPTLPLVLGTTSMIILNVHTSQQLSRLHFNFKRIYLATV